MDISRAHCVWIHRLCLGGRGRAQMAARWRAPAESGRAVSVRSVARVPQMAWSSMCSSSPSCPVPLVLHTAISLPTCAKEKGPGVSREGSQRQGELLCWFGDCPPPCPWAPADLCCCVPFPGQPQQRTTASRTPLCTRLQRDTWGQSPFCLICAMALEAVAYLGCHCFFKDGWPERHSAVHSADQGDAPLCVDLVKQVKQHTGFLKMFWIRTAF